MANTNETKNTATANNDVLELLKKQLAEKEKQAAEATDRAEAAEKKLEAIAKANATKTVAKPKMVKIRIPRMRKDEADVFVSVNDYTCIVKRGVEVEVPDFVAEVLQHREKMLEVIALAGEK